MAEPTFTKKTLMDEGADQLISTLKIRNHFWASIWTKFKQSIVLCWSNHQMISSFVIVKVFYHWSILSTPFLYVRPKYLNGLLSLLSVSCWTSQIAWAQAKVEKTKLQFFYHIFTIILFFFLFPPQWKQLHKTLLQITD